MSADTNSAGHRGRNHHDLGHASANNSADTLNRTDGEAGPSSLGHPHHPQDSNSSNPPPPPAQPLIRRVGGKANVSAACGPCKRAHLACDINRPCKRCINMGKEALCEDVPHKKRGRPKISKPALGEPYSRVAQPPAPAPWVPQPPSPPPTLFEVFTTTDLKVVRATQGTVSLTGFHPHEFLNLSLNEFIHPSDRHLIEFERQHLVPIGQSPRRTTPEAMAALSERVLMSPAPGMREPYPNQNVRILRSDHGYDWFNVRLHLGGGLGASLYEPETLNDLYIVVSLLLLQPPPDFDRRNFPLTPVSGLPSFSSFAAVAERPAARTARHSIGSATQPYPAPRRSASPPAIIPNYYHEQPYIARRDSPQIATTGHGPATGHAQHPSALPPPQTLQSLHSPGLSTTGAPIMPLSMPPTATGPPPPQQQQQQQQQQHPGLHLPPPPLAANPAGQDYARRAWEL